MSVNNDTDRQLHIANCLFPIAGCQLPIDSRLQIFPISRLVPLFPVPCHLSLVPSLFIKYLAP